MKPLTIQNSLHTLILAGILSIGVCHGPGAMAQEYSNDPGITSSTSFVIDAFDYLVWNHHKFTVVGGGPDMGDGNSDGVVDAADFAIWNAAKYTGMGPMCIDDRMYFNELTLPTHAIPVNISPLGGPAPPGGPTFSVTSGITDQLSISLPTGSDLNVLTVFSDTPAVSLGPNFNYSGTTTGGYIPLNRRQEWIAEFSGITLAPTEVVADLCLAN